MRTFSSTEDFIWCGRHFDGYRYGQHIYGFIPRKHYNILVNEFSGESLYVKKYVTCNNRLWL